MARADTVRYAELAKLAAQTALAVGERIKVDDIAIVTRKRGRANFATAADHAAEAEILRRLRAHDKTIPILAEESADRKLRTAERLWVVDPLDGTLNFSRALPFYCVAIAYVEDGKARAQRSASVAGCIRTRPLARASRRVSGLALVSTMRLAPRSSNAIGSSTAMRSSRSRTSPSLAARASAE